MAGKSVIDIFNFQENDYGDVNDESDILEEEIKGMNDILSIEQMFNGLNNKERNVYSVIKNAIIKADLNKLASVYKACCSLIEDAEVITLMVAITQDQEEICNWILDNIADINKCCVNGITPLMVAALKQRQNIVQRLLDIGAKVNKKNLKGHTALMSAAYGGNADIIKTLYCKGVILNQQSDGGFTALMFAVANINLAAISVLVKYADANLCDNAGNTALHLAAKIGDEKSVKMLISYVADINLINKDGKTALAVATEEGNVAIVEYLKATGALEDVNCLKENQFAGIGQKETPETVKSVINSDTPAIVSAAFNGDIASLLEQIQLGISVNITDELGRTPLMAASQIGHMEKVLCLVENKAHINQTNNAGVTALAYAVYFMNKYVSEYLVEQGALLDIQDIQGRTLFMNMVETGRLELVTAVDVLGCNIFQTDKLDKSALMIAAEYGYLDIVEYLINQGYSTVAESSENLTASQYAFINEHTEVQRFLDSCHTLGENEFHHKDIVLEAAVTGNGTKLQTICKKGHYIDYIHPTGTGMLCIAAQKKHLSVVKALVTHGAVVNRRNQNDGRNALFQAVLNGCGQVVDYLLESGATTNFPDSKGYTPLMAAAQEMYIDITKALLKYGARTVACDQNNLCVLSYAVKSGSEEMVQLLLDHGTCTNVADDDGMSPLHYAAMKGDLNIVKLLIEHNANIHYINNKGHSAIEVSGQIGNRHIFDYLIKCGANMPSMSSLQNSLDENFTKFMQTLSLHESQDNHSKRERSKHASANKYGYQLMDESSNVNENYTQSIFDLCSTLPFDTQSCQRLLDKGININRKEENGNTALLIALQNKYGQIADWLIDKGADVNCQNDKGFSAMMYACQYGDINMIKNIISHKGDLELTDVKNCTALFHAVKSKHLTAVEYLLKHGTNINHQDCNEESVLMFSCRNNDYELMKILLKYKASVNLRNVEGKTALSLCVPNNTRNNCDFVRCLISSGISVDSVDKTGHTPLMLCMLCSNVMVATELLSLGANINCTDRETDQCAFMMAATSENLDLFKLFVDYQANINPDNKITVLQYLIYNDKIYEAVLLMQSDKSLLCHKYWNDILSSVLVQQNNMNWCELLQKPGLLNQHFNSHDVLCQRLHWSHKPNTCVSSILKYLHLSALESDKQAALLMCLSVGYYEEFCNLVRKVMSREAESTQCITLSEISKPTETSNQLCHCQRTELTIIQAKRTSKVIATKDMPELSSQWNKESPSTQHLLNITHSTRKQKYHHMITKLDNLKKEDVMLQKENEALTEQLKRTEAESYQRHFKMAKTDEELKVVKKEAQTLEKAKTGEELKVVKNEIQKLQKSKIHEESINAEKETQMLQKTKTDVELKVVTKETQTLEKTKTDKELKVVKKETQTVQESIHTRSIPPKQSKSQTIDVEKIYQQWQLCVCGITGCKQCDFNKEAISVHKESQIYSALPQDKMQEQKVAGKGVQNGNGKENNSNVKQPQKPRENVRHISVIPHKDKPYPRIYLFKFHGTVSQSSLDGRQMPSNACAIIAMLFAHFVVKRPIIISVVPPPLDIPNDLFHYVVRAIREGNQVHELNFQGEPVDLGPQEVSLLTTHLGVSIIKETDVDTRDPDSLIDLILKLKANQVILFIKNFKVISICPCNRNKFLLLFDSHPHQTHNAVFGTYLFLAKKDKETVESLVKSYEAFCDPRPFYGHVAIFDI